MLFKFPQGTSPPGDSFDYDVDYSTPPLVIIFLDWRVNPKINQTIIENLLQKAIIEASDFEKKEVLLELGIHWQIEFPYILSVSTKDPKPSQKRPARQIGLTWGVWTDALIGFNRFRTAYPELEFRFSLYIEDRGYEKVLVGSGYLDTDFRVQASMLRS